MRDFKADRLPEGRPQIPVEWAEVFALQAMRLGQGRHLLSPAKCRMYADVLHHLDDLHRATVNLCVGNDIAYSFDIVIVAVGRHPNPDDLFDSSM